MYNISESMKAEKPMKELINQIKSFCASCEQEKKDQEVIIHRLENEGERLLHRTSELYHFTSSAFVFDKDKSKVLVVHHNIYNTWAFVGGHADGESDLLKVALREVKEETGLEQIHPITNQIRSIDILTTSSHFRKGVYVPAHLHFNISYAMTGDLRNPIRIKPDENTAVKWIDVSDIDTYIIEPEMNQIFKKLI